MGGSFVCKNSIPLAICLAIASLAIIDILWLLSCKKSKSVAFLTEKIYPVAEFIYNVVLVLILCNTDQCNKVWMVPNFYWCHNLASEFLGIWWRHIVFYALYRHFTASPLSFKDLRWMPKTYFTKKFQRWKVDKILLCIFFHLLNNETF